LDIPEGYIGSSGSFMPDEREVSWREIADDLGTDLDSLLEKTTLTKLPRRIAKPANNMPFSGELIKRSLMTIGFNILSMTFLNYKGIKNPNDPKFLGYKESVDLYLQLISAKTNIKNPKFKIAQFGSDILDVYFV